mgnify:CR=1 FL=1
MPDDFLQQIKGDKNMWRFFMNKLIKTNLPDWRLVMLEADNDGAVIENNL